MSLSGGGTGLCSRQILSIDIRVGKANHWSRGWGYGK